MHWSQTRGTRWVKSKSKEAEAIPMKVPIKAQLNDLKWWDENAPEWATHYVISHCATPGGWYELKGAGGYKMFHNSEEYEFQIDNYRKELLDVYERPTNPAAPEWDGKGLPPVGCECEVLYGSGWELSKVIHITCAGIVVCETNVGNVYHTTCPEDKIRPLRTKEQRRRDDLAKLLDDCQMKMGSFWTPEKQADAIIAAGWRKEAD